MSLQPSSPRVNGRSKKASDDSYLKVPVNIDQQDLIRLSIEDIYEYEYNPRHENNLAYEAIKSSIRKQGILQPLTVTRRPDESHYLIRNGGNTRLRIVKELFTKTQDPRFSHLNCIFEPWQNESNVLAAHLIENEIRDDLTLIDKARAIREIKRMLDEELGKRISQRELVRCLHDRGYRVDSPLLSRLDYALDTLWPVIPEALRGGLSRTQIAAIRSLEEAVIKLTRERGTSKHDTEYLRKNYLSILGRFDDTDWDLGPALNETVEWLSVLFKENINITRLDIDAILAGRSPGPDAVPSTPLPDLQRARPNPVTASNRSSNNSQDHGNASDNNDFSDTYEKVIETEPTNQSIESPATSSSNKNFVPSSDALSGQELLSADHIISTESCPSDLKKLRLNMWILADRLAQRAGLTDQVLLQQQGTGFIMDFPLDSLLQDASNAYIQEWHITSIWWFLASISEQFVIPHQRLAEILPASARLNDYCHAIEAGADPTTILLSLVGPMPFEWTGSYFFGRLTCEEYQNINGMIATSMTMHALCPDHEHHSMWEM